MPSSLFDDDTLFVEKDKSAWIALLSFIAYVIAFPLPAYVDKTGFFAFYVSFFGLGDGFLAWLANPLYWFALYSLRTQPQHTTIVGTFAVPLALAPLVQMTTQEIDDLRMGYFVWLLSHVLLLVAGVVALSRAASHPRTSISKKP